MTLQEKAFMIDLIKKNYRRRMTFLILKCMLLLVGYLIPAGHIMTIVGISCVTIAALLLFLNHQPFGFDMASPWKIKKVQAEALEQHSKADFEELSHSVPLKEYFEI